uniref:Uncharacterized protein n=1 Tax=Sus scrofa TaxID=9823 RepID=A0A4X1VE20_PIG
HIPLGSISDWPGLPPLPPALQLTCCRHKFCFLGVSSQSWVSQELALFKGCGENWGEIRCFVRPVQCCPRSPKV